MPQNLKRPRLTEDGVTNDTSWTDDLDVELDADINFLAQELGFADADEFVPMIDIADEAAKKLAERKDLFFTSVENTTNLRVGKLINALDDNESMQDVDAMVEEYLSDKQHFLDKVKTIFEESVDTIESANSSYFMSLSGVTIIDAARLFALYFEFLETHCKEKNLQGFEIEALRQLDYPQRLEKLRILFTEYTIYFRLRYKISPSIAKLKNAENIEPTTITAYCFRLFIAFKIIGLIKLDTTRKQMMGDTLYVQTRATLRTLGTNKYLFKEKISAVDLVELLKRVEFGNMAELQHALFLLLLAETGLRLTSTLAVSERLTGFSGLSLKDITFRFVDDIDFEVTIRVRYEKTNKLKVGNRTVTIYSKARYDYICAATLLLIFVCTCGFTKEPLTKCIANRRVEFRQECLDIPLFSECRGPNIFLGTPGTNPIYAFQWLSLKTSIPRSLLAVNSLRKGHATSLMEHAYLANNQTSEAGAVRQVVSSKTWIFSSCKNYFSHAIGPKLTSYKLYNQPIDTAIADSILENLSCGVFLSDTFIQSKPSEEYLRNRINVDRLTAAQDAVEEYKQKSALSQFCKSIREKYRVQRVSASSGLNDEDYEKYVTSMKQLKKEIRSVHLRASNDFMKQLDKEMLERWQNTKKSIKQDERFIPMKPEFVANLNFALIEEHFKDIQFPTPFYDWTFVSDVKTVITSGIPCPYVANPSECNAVIKTMKSLKKHRKDHPSNGEQLYYCHHEDCKKLKGMTEKAFQKHNSEKHRTKVDSVFEQFKLPMLVDRCELCESIPKEAFMKCIKESQNVVDILSSSNIEAVFSLISKTMPGITRRDLGRQSLLKNLGLEVLPQCLNILLEDL